MYRPSEHPQLRPDEQQRHPSQSHSHSQPRAVPKHHRRTKPQLSINTFDANDYSRSPEYGKDSLSTPLSPPPNLDRLPHVSAASPVIPYKSSKRSLRGGQSPVTPSSAQLHRHHKREHHGLVSSRSHQQLGTRRPASPVSDSPHNTDKESAQSFTIAPAPAPYQERDARARQPRLKVRKRSPDDEPHWATDDLTDQTFFDTFPPLEMSSKENPSPAPDGQNDPFARFDSHPRTPRARSRSPSRSQGHRAQDSHDLSLSPRNVTRDSLLGNMLLSLDLFSMGQTNTGPGDGGATRAMSGFAESSRPYYYNELGNTPGGGAGAASRTMTSATTRTVRAGSGGRAHGYSYSSDYETADDSNRGRKNSNIHYVARSRRSNSSSTAGFHSSLSQLNSMRERTNQWAARGTKGQRPSLHSRGERGSKSSSASSIDPGGYASVLGNQRWAHGAGVPKRSLSVELTHRKDLFGTQLPAEHDTRRQKQQQQTQQQLQELKSPAPWISDFTNSVFHPSDQRQHFDGETGYDDAAPTPTVPAGPSRQLLTMPSMPSFGRPAPMGEPLSPVRSVILNPLERKRSNKSPRSIATRQSYHSTRYDARGEWAADPPPPLPQPGSFPVADSSDLPDSAPAPHVGYEKAKEKEPVHAPAPQPAVPQPKEKQGFFRRMFGGGSKNNADQSATAASANTSPIESLSNSPALIVNTMSGSTSTTVSASRFSPHTSSPLQSSPGKPTGTPPSRQTSSHGLQKKPSGFFRRRKKSVSVSTEPLPLPPALPLPPVTMPPVELAPVPKRLDLITPRAGLSSLTSLRKAMDPYLNSSQSTASSPAVSTPQDNHTLSSYHSAVEEINQIGDGNPRSFSPDYEPDPRATIRSVRSQQQVGKDQSPAPERRRPVTPTRDVSKPHHDHERTGSFLHDTSDSDGSPKRVRKRAEQQAVEIHVATAPDTKGRTALAPLQTDLPLASPSSDVTIKDKKLDRLTQDSVSTNATDRPGSLHLPIEGARTDKDLKTRVSAASIPSLTVEDPDGKTPFAPAAHPLDEPAFVIGEPTEDEKAKAQKIYDGNEDFIPKEKAASWMGEEGPIRQRTLRAYMDLFSFSNKNIATCLRDVCNRLVLRAETQQVDRILVTFSQRWVDCNPNHGFKSTDVIHTICYSIMLLNTDLHMADIESKMTRSQFVKNTMGTVRRAAIDSVPEAFDRPSILPGKGFDEGRGSGEHERAGFRNSFMKLPVRTGSALGEHSGDDDCGPLVKAPFEGSLKAWESQMEVVLKEIYTSIRDEKLPLFGAEQVTEQAQAAGGLSVIGMLKRSPSVLSKAASENPSSRGRGPDSMLAGNSRWASKSRSRPRGYGNAGFASSRTSFDDGQSIWSPVESIATWSRASLGRTHTSISMDSFGSRFPRGDYQQSIGFANALSQAIIREDPLGSVPSLASDELKPTQLLEDESLELAGPPWVKEGIIMHKHHLDGVDKKARDRNWSEVFCVIQKGNVSIFSFTPNKSTAKRGRNAPKKGGVVGGGNWQENATSLGTWNLRLCLASALPPPGYSKQRTHVWALSLPTGAVHLFHVGTAEICSEFVMTVNYWSARLSTHPLVGGVSNVEYGWSDAIINNALIAAINDSSTANVVPGTGRQRSGSVAATRTSLHSRNSSFRSAASFDFSSTLPRSTSALGGALSSSKLPGDVVTVAEWRAPTQSMRLSNAGEKEQLQILETYVRSIEEDLQQHNSLRSPMLLAFTPRGSNAQRAMANWERRSAYLLREIVKFRTYVDALQVADARKTEIYRERDIARRAAQGSLDGADADADADADDVSSDGGDCSEERERGRVASRNEAVEVEGNMTLRP